MAKTSHELAIEFAVEITELCSKIKGRPEYTKQLIRSASSISANIAEAKYAESNADFVHKLEIAQKEANETENWPIEIDSQICQPCIFRSQLRVSISDIIEFIEGRNTICSPSESYNIKALESCESEICRRRKRIP